MKSSSSTPGPSYLASRCFSRTTSSRSFRISLSCGSSFRMAFVLMSFAWFAKRRVLRLSWKFTAAGLMAASITVLEFPTSESRKIHVSTLSRNGMWSERWSAALAAAAAAAAVAALAAADEALAADFFLGVPGLEPWALLATSPSCSSAAAMAASSCSASAVRSLLACLASRLITRPRHERDLLMAPPSFSLSPDVSALFARSDPAKSMRVIFVTCAFFLLLLGLMPASAAAVASRLPLFFCVISRVNTAWLREEVEFIAVAAVVRFSKPSSSKSEQSAYVFTANLLRLSTTTPRTGSSRTLGALPSPL
mmetsp:Transcript_33016/g.65779  ORF Transcript_33016/g.65779 Transcript_33016/m.65779 type:complete len:309 (-) Transcript_33016:224-1150(-)